MTTEATDSAEGREMFPKWGLFSLQHGAFKKKKKSCQFCVCGFMKQSLSAQSCKFINLTAINRALLCLLSAMVRACAVTSAGASQTHAVLLPFSEGHPHCKITLLKKWILHHISWNSLSSSFFSA